MSLTITFTASLVPHYTRIDGTTIEIGEKEVASISTAYNLNKIAERISIGLHTTLYDLLWHGNELENPIVYGHDFISYLIRVIPYMEDHREDLEKFNQDDDDNFNDLLLFTEKCLAYAILYPDSIVHFNT